MHNMSVRPRLCEAAGFCRQQIEDIAALAGHVNDAGSRYSITTEGKLLLLVR